MDFGLTEDELEDLLTARVGQVLDRNIIKAVAIAVATNNARIAREVQRRIDQALGEILH